MLSLIILENNMGIIHTKLITDPAAWNGAEFATNSSWIRVLSKTAITELKNAVKVIKSRKLSFPYFTKDDFLLPTLSTVLATFGTELETEQGFILLRGIPVDAYDNDEDLDILYYGIALHIGEPVRQNPQGDLIGRVVNIGNQKNPQTRVYETNAYLHYHSDPSDVVGLLCIRPAKSGGVSSLISSNSLYNEILKRYPEYLSILHRPMWYPHVGTEPCLSPIFSYNQGKLSCRYMRQYIELAQETMGFTFSPIEIEAFDLIDSIMQEEGMRVDMMMQSGDLQLVNNYTVLHSRNSFEDHEDIKLRRKKHRVWLKTPQARQLGYEFPGRHGFPNPS